MPAGVYQMKNSRDSNVIDEQAVASHYGDAALLERLLAGLEASGLDIEHLQPADLAPIEEFHIGGRKATEYVVDSLALATDQHVLDVGCGIGGAVRYIADTIGCRVTGVDLTPEYIHAAKALSRHTGLHDRTRFDTGSALAMAYDDEHFDAVITLHAAMNIADREALYAEIARVLKPGGVLCVYDVMKKSDEPIAFPVPWAASADTSHLITRDETLSLLDEAGFAVHRVDDRTRFAIEFFRESLARVADGPSPLGVHLVMGETAQLKFRNTLDGIERGCIGPVQVVARKRAMAA